MKLYLQTIIDSVQLENLPLEWIDFDFVKFSTKKTLFDYQQQALKNALKALYKYYIDCNSDKEEFFKLYQSNGLIENLDLKLNESKKYKIFNEFSNEYKIENNKIPFYYFINRMSFWMATGSGKTLVIIKLIELIAKLIHNQQIPNNDILFLTYREDLIEQFKKHIEEFSYTNSNIYINLYSLKDYEKVKRENKLKYRQEIDIFYYRSDLISNEQKDKIIDFRNYDNNGKWYVLLDEAHKGDKEDSKRQFYYSILARNGALFNFSATFTEEWDFITCVFNFNLEKFIQQGYGKHIYISHSNVSSLGKKEDFTDTQKQLIIIKILLLHTLIKITRPLNYYHEPLILTLVNSVNTEDSDLFLFFKELEKIASGNIANNFEALLKQAKEELKAELSGKCEFDNESIKLDNSLLENLTLTDLLKNVFNSETNGNIEVLKIPGNKQELILKLTTSDKPFALIKIGDISEWLKNKLSDYQIIEKFDNESIFKNINQSYSDINLLMGSRAFYEGWDSNRPNLILYINIGKGIDAKKFVLQSVGRGVRIEPLPNKRKRLQFLYNNNEVNKDTFELIKDKIQLVETLFIYGTKAENLKEVIETLKEEKQEEIIGDLFEINPEVKDKLLLVPVYKPSEQMLVDQPIKIKYEITTKDYDLIKDYYNYIGDKVFLIKYNVCPKILKKVEESFKNKEEFYKTDNNICTIANPDIIIKRLLNHFSLKSKEFKEFKTLEKEIVHFKQIRISQKKQEEIKRKIQHVLNYKEKDKKIQEITEKIQKEPQKAVEYVKEIENITTMYVKEAEVRYDTEAIKLKYLQNHYYIPVIISNNEKIDYIKHIIKTKSEIEFINQLETYLKEEDNLFTKFDWWFFSKIDETIDEVYIPYYQPKTNRIEKFKPDFIFWLKKADKYIILFIDPKGTEHTEGYRKIDGYKRIFKNNEFKYNDYTVKIILKLKTNNINKVLEEYKEFWFSDIKELKDEILSFLFIFCHS